ncbi:hypothetical protein Tco_1414519 [Tanacetum coccineum]
MVWFDIGCSHCPLVRFLSPRDITREGFHLQNRVADMMANGGWIWPQSWLLKAPDLGIIPAPNLGSSRLEKTTWRDTNINMSECRMHGKLSDHVWYEHIGMVWFDIWFSHCPLVRFVSPRDVTREGFHLQNHVADMMANGG